MKVDRRQVTLGAAAAALLFPRSAAGQEVFTDSSGRTVLLPGGVRRIFASGGPAAVVVYVLRPDAMIGWPRAIRPEERPYLLPEVRDLPEVGMLSGRGDTANVEVVLRSRPDLIVDFGSVRPTYVSLADTVQSRTGIPYVLIDGRFEATAASLRMLGRVLGVPERGEALARYTEDLFGRLDRGLSGIADDQRPRVYLARGPTGLETGLKGSINTEILERAGGRNVADAGGQRRGIVNVSPEQVLVWNPDIIVTWDRNFHARVRAQTDPLWASVQAVQEGRVYLAPTAPFGWIDRPPSINRLIGLAWLANLFHGDRFPFDFRQETRKFYKLFYHVDVNEAELDTLLAWADGRPPGAPSAQ
ncbi:MAG: iron ABC transporter substrate-binding protein [Hyphomicrobiaceae bacterium]|nr:iron ABC transporter substrate-binding protein [Hyphomicrobiaceae bacterium]